jgi:hypothetical protein
MLTAANVTSVASLVMSASSAGRVLALLQRRPRFGDPSLALRRPHALLPPPPLGLLLFRSSGGRCGSRGLPCPRGYLLPLPLPLHRLSFSSLGLPLGQPFFLMFLLPWMFLMSLLPWMLLMFLLRWMSWILLGTP